MRSKLSDACDKLWDRCLDYLLALADLPKIDSRRGLGQDRTSVIDRGACRPIKFHCRVEKLAAPAADFESFFVFYAAISVSFRFTCTASYLVN